MKRNVSLLEKLRTLDPSEAKVSSELRRILALPRRPPVPGPDTWTERLKTPGGSMSLRPVQSWALDEASTAGGLLGSIGVGAGKTLVTLLLPVVWGARRSVLLVPPRLKRKLFERELPELKKHWRIPEVVDSTEGITREGAIHVVSYSDLSSIKRGDVLDVVRPDVIVCDEAHALRHATAARTKRFRRYLRTYAKSGHALDDVGGSGPPLLRCAFLSGTLTDGSILDYAHLAGIALGSGSPLPLEYVELQAWSAALDPQDGFDSTRPAALECLCAVGEPVRRGYRRRLVETPGVVATTDNNPGMALVFDVLPLEAPKVVTEALDRARSGIDPDGNVLTEVLDVYRFTRQLSCGFFYRPVFPRGESPELIQAWRQAKRDYESEVRDRLARNRKGQDSPELLRRAAESGEWKSEFYPRWAAIRDAVKPSRETVWLSTFLVGAAVKWALEAPGLVWVESEAVNAAMAIAKDAGIPVYAAKEDAAALWAEKGDRSVVVAANVFKEGENLQAFHRNLVTTIPPRLEQLLGRTHRPGQTADEVTVDFCLHTPELRRALKGAISDAHYTHETLGNQQKLILGTYAFEV